MAFLGAYLAYFGASVALLALGLTVYVLVTPYRELALIRQGNTAAAYSLGGTAIGLAAAIASAVAHSVGLVDMAIWAASACFVQLGVYGTAALLLRDLKQAIVADRIGYGVFLGALSLAVGILNAACLTW